MEDIAIATVQWMHHHFFNSISRSISINISLSTEYIGSIC